MAESEKRPSENRNAFFTSKSSYKLIPLILKRFNNFLLGNANGALTWKFDGDSLKYVISNASNDTVATVDVAVSDVRDGNHQDNINVTECFNFGITLSGRIADSDKQIIVNDLKSLVFRAAKLEKRFPEIYANIFPRDAGGLIDWNRCSISDQSLRKGFTKNRRIDIQGGKCRLKCAFCSVPLMYNKINPIAEQLLQYERLYTAIIDIGAAATTGLSLHFLSTDPVSHPDIVSLLRFAKTAGYAHIGIATAMMHELDGALLADLAASGLDELNIPLYGVTAETNDVVTGRTGHFEHLVLVASQAKNLDIKIKFHSVALKMNLHELEAIPALAEKLGGYFFNFLYVRYHGDKRLSVDNLMPRITDLPLSVRRRLNLQIPCIEAGADFAEKTANGNSMAENIRQGNNVHLDNQYEYEYAEKCATCTAKHECSGVFPPYLQVFGDGEFKPLN